MVLNLGYWAFNFIFIKFLLILTFSLSLSCLLFAVVVVVVVFHFFNYNFLCSWPFLALKAEKFVSHSVYITGFTLIYVDHIAHIVILSITKKQFTSKLPEIYFLN